MYVAERIIFCIKVQCKDIFESIWGKYSFQLGGEGDPTKLENYRNPRGCQYTTSWQIICAEI